MAFLTGGRATELLAFSRGMFADMGGWYEGMRLPVFKRFRIIDKYLDEDTGKYKYETLLETGRRTIPILKTEPLAGMFWDMIKDRDRGEPLLHWPDHNNQYWQLYKCIKKIPAPFSSLAPFYHKGPKRGKQKHLYPHWFRGMRAAQLRVQYNLDIGKLCDFFRWETLDMARHYAGLSIVEMVVAMRSGERYMEIWEEMMSMEE